MVVTLAIRLIHFFKKNGYLQNEIASAVPEAEMIQWSLLPNCKLPQCNFLFGS
jgi:hypothetical protein